MIGIADDTSARRMIVADPAMRAVLRRIELVAPSAAPVLICGESGTGKDVAAARLHECSGRAGRPFVAVDCAALTDIAEQDIFGPARGGTLLLDNVGEIDAGMQARLLQALRQLESAGAEERPPARILATASFSMLETVQLGRFRPDLFFRLNVIEIKLPPLRDRPGDIPALADHFAREIAANHGLPTRPLLQAAQDSLLRHSWPGNVRELQNVIHRAVLTETGPAITPAALELDLADPGKLAVPTALSTEGRTIEAVEKDMILDRLRQCKGNRAQAAATLGISIRTLRNKLNDYERNGTRIPRPVVVAVA